jgi:isoleucyl-tRNA synthetase
VQREQFQRLGVMGEWDDPYLTMNYEAEAAIVGELLKFAESGQLYRGAKPVMWSPVEKTALAEAEVEYEDITSTQIDVGFEITESPNAPGLVGAIAVIWTTTPWTIPVNQALAFGPDIDYVVLNCVNVLGGNPYILIARDLVPSFCKRAGLPVPVEFGGDYSPEARAEGDNGPSVIGEPAFTIVGKQLTDVVPDMYSFKGKVLEGTVARHPMHHLGGFFAKPRPFLPGEHVTTDAGTGLVHMAPDHGEEDFDVCRRAGIEPVFAVMDDGPLPRRLDLARRRGRTARQRHQPEVQRARRPDLLGPARSRRPARRIRGLPPLLPAQLAVQGQGHLPLHPAMVHPDG